MKGLTPAQPQILHCKTVLTDLTWSNVCQIRPVKQKLKAVVYDIALKQFVGQWEGHLACKNLALLNLE